MEFIKCEKKHYDSVVSLYHQAIAHLEANINYPLWTSDHPSDVSTAKSIEIGEQYICVNNGEVTGTVALSEDPDGDYEKGGWSRYLKLGEFLVIHVLAVHPKYERQGIGGFLVKECIKIARERGYKAVRLDVVPGNIPAERLYKNHGFTYADSADLNRNLVDVPLFDLYELNL